MTFAIIELFSSCINYSHPLPFVSHIYLDCKLFGADTVSCSVSVHCLAQACAMALTKQTTKSALQLVLWRTAEPLDLMAFCRNISVWRQDLAEATAWTLFLHIWSTEAILQDFKDLTIVTKYKMKSEKSYCDSYTISHYCPFLERF